MYVVRILVYVYVFVYDACKLRVGIGSYLLLCLFESPASHLTRFNALFIRYSEHASIQLEQEDHIALMQNRNVITMQGTQQTGSRINFKKNSASFDIIIAGIMMIRSH